jgi:hypothetical protein
MTRLLVFIVLFSATLSVYAQTCPAAPEGYYFNVAAWGDHYTAEDVVRCHYYHVSDSNKHIQIDTIEKFKESDISRHSEWKNIGELYHICYGQDRKVEECPFN